MSVRQWYRSAATAVVCSLLWTTSAFADTPAPPEAVAGMDDEVTLKDNGTLRGVVISVEPGRAVKILVVGDKEARTLPWARVADVEKGKYAPASKLPAPGAAGSGYGGTHSIGVGTTVEAKPTEGEPTATKPTEVKPSETRQKPEANSTSEKPKAVAPKAEAPLEKRKVRVHVDSPKPTTLMRSTAASEPGPPRAPEKVCEAPCDVEVDVSGGDRFYADGSFPSTRSFDLADVPPEQTAVVRVSPGSNGRRIGGVVSLASGVVLGAVGIGVLTVDYLECAVGCPLEEANSFTDRALGGTLVSLGIVGVVGGIVLIATSGSSASVGDEAAPRVTTRLWIGEPPPDARPSTARAPYTGAAVLGVQGHF